MIKVEHTRTKVTGETEFTDIDGRYVESLVTDAKLVLVEEGVPYSKPISISETEKIEVGDWY